MMAGVGLLAVVVNGARLSPGELAGMYADPEYADTWRYTNDHRYVEEGQWAKDAPAAYKDHMGLVEDSFIQHRESEAVPDYWSHDYSGNKHWGFAADPFYGDNEAWVESSPKGYDDYVRMQTGAANVYDMGVTFMPDREPKANKGINLGFNLAQQTEKVHADIPDYWGYDYSGEKHWKWANDPFYANPDEWIKSAPQAYDTLAQVHTQSVPGVTFLYKPLVDIEK